jgi:hypothetical protein
MFTLFLLAINFLTFAAAPTVPSSNLSFYAIDGGYFNLGYTSGNGARRMMVAKVGSEPTFIPQNNTSYTANTTFGLGQEVAPGEFIVFDGVSSFFLTGLTPATHYYFRLFDYNGTGNAKEYLTSSYLSGDGWTSKTPTIQSSNAAFSNITSNSFTVNFTAGDGQRRLIVMKEGAPVDVDPVNNTSYGGANSIFGSGTSLGNGNYAVYWSSSTYTTVSNLKAGTKYYLAFYESNGNQEPQFLKPAYTTSVTTTGGPTVASSAMSVTKSDGKELTLNWTNGNGQRRIVIAKKGSDVTAVPVNGNDYTANASFGQGQQLAPGEYVVYDDNYHSTTVSGLDPATTYYFRVFEYDGTGSNTIYLTSGFAAVSGSTVTKPTVQSQFLSTTNVTANSLRLNFAPGNGRARMIIGRSGAPVNSSPVDLTLYADHTYFGSGQDLGNGNFVLSYTTAQSETIQKLQPNTTYHFAIYELNGFNQPLYLTPAALVSATTTGTLPVKLISWEASLADNKVNLQWKTGSEANASHFVVERSADGVAFTPVTTVSAVGNSAVEKTYSAVDNQPLSGKSFYRLKMVDKDSRWEYASVRTVTIAAGIAVKILENPVRENLKFVSSGSNRMEWKIVNVSGQVIGKGSVTSGQNNISVSSLLSGRYWLRLDDAGQTYAIPFIKQ